MICILRLRIFSCQGWTTGGYNQSNQHFDYEITLFSMFDGVKPQCFDGKIGSRWLNEVATSQPHPNAQPRQQVSKGLACRVTPGLIGIPRFIVHHPNLRFYREMGMFIIIYIINIYIYNYIYIYVYNIYIYIHIHSGDQMGIPPTFTNTSHVMPFGWCAIGNLVYNQLPEDLCEKYLQICISSM